MPAFVKVRLPLLPSFDPGTAGLEVEERRAKMQAMPQMGVLAPLDLGVMRRVGLWVEAMLVFLRF